MGFKMKRSNMAGGIMIDRKPDGHMPDYRAKSAPLQMKKTATEIAREKAAKEARKEKRNRPTGPLEMKGTPNMEMQDNKKKKKPSQGDFVPAFEGADISKAEYDKKMKLFTAAGFSKSQASNFIRDNVSLAEAKKNKK
tara:strand:- start:1220 stop:1633 length:414 start_codon:yes stop_codon:yes gene_type:complete